MKALRLIAPPLPCPRPSACQVFKELRTAVKGCHDLHTASIEVIGNNWMDAASAAAAAAEDSAPDGASQDVGAAAAAGPAVPPLPPPPEVKSANQRCEDAMLMFVKASRAVEENLVIAENEVITGEA